MSFCFYLCRSSTRLVWFSRVDHPRKTRRSGSWPQSQWNRLKTIDFRKIRIGSFETLYLKQHKTWGRKSIPGRIRSKFEKSRNRQSGSDWLAPRVVHLVLVDGQFRRCSSHKPCKLHKQTLRELTVYWINLWVSFRSTASRFRFGSWSRVGWEILLSREWMMNNNLEEGFFSNKYWSY